MAEDYKEFIRIVLNGDDATQAREKFIKAYSSEIDEFKTNMELSFDAWHLLDSECLKDKRDAYISPLIYICLTTHVVSLKLFIDGLMVPAGNSQRYVLESIAMSVLAASPQHDYLDRFARGEYSTTKAIRDLRRNAKSLRISMDMVNQLERASNLYDQYSHPTLVTLGSNIMLDPENPNIVFGSEFDPAKKELIYDKEIASKVNLAAIFPDFIQGVIRLMGSDK